MQQNSLAYARNQSDECREHGNPVKRRLHETTIFTIDKQNNITAFASAKKADSNPESQRFRSAKELDKVAQIYSFPLRRNLKRPARRKSRTQIHEPPG
jgi:hypothetical protein